MSDVMTGERGHDIAAAIDQIRIAWVDHDDPRIGNVLSETARTTTPNVLVATARLLLAHGRHQEAQALLRRAFDIEPDEPTSVAWLVAALARGYEHDEAVAAGQRQLDAHPDSVGLRVAVGRAQFDAGRIDSALGHLAIAVEGTRMTGRLATGTRGSSLMFAVGMMR